MLARRRLAAALVIAAASSAGLTACGAHEHVTEAKSEGIYVTAGHVKYQVQISRQLNPSSFEDRDYLVGVSDTELGKGEQYFAVFLRAFNRDESGQAHRTASRFWLSSTKEGDRWDPVPVDTKVNRVAYVPAELHAGDQLPLPGSLARENPTQGGLILFKIPVKAYDSRPLKLHIQADDGKDSTIALDV